MKVISSISSSFRWKVIGISIVITVILLVKILVKETQIDEQFNLFFSSRTCLARPTTQTSSSSYEQGDFISPISMKLLGDAHFGTAGAPPDRWEALDRKDLRYMLGCLKPGAVIFVDTNNLNKFLHQYYDKIKAPFVLITGDTDLSAPDVVDMTTLSHSFLDSKSRIIHWFAMNCGRNLSSSRFSCLMNGLSQWDGHGQVQGIKQHGSVKNNGSRSIMQTQKNSSYSLLVSFNYRSNPLGRKHVWDTFCTDPKAYVSCFYAQAKQQELYYMMGSSKFVLSPHGRGLDCYRTYEALYLGSYVVVKTSTLDEMYTDLPVLIVQDWNDITEDLLTSTFERFQRTNYSYDKIFTNYWYYKFRSFGYAPYSYTLTV
jgi:hypothetical protein